MNLQGTKRFFPYSPAAVLKISGADAATFLQGQFTNDLRLSPAGGASYGLWLNHKGKVLADSFVRVGSGEGEFLVWSYFSSAAVIRERLEAYIIADDVVIEDRTDRWRAISLLDPGAEGVLERLSPAVITFRGRRTRSGNWEGMFPAENDAPVHAALLENGWVEGSAAEIERLRISEGVPAVPQDIGPGELPQEGGLENPAISYTKGCYLGQEVMARLKSMGQVRRRLLRVRGHSGNHPLLPAPLFLGERRVGELRSAAFDNGGFLGLALLNLLQVNSGSVLSFSAGETPTVRVDDESFSS